MLGGAPLRRTFAAGEAFHFAAAEIHRVLHAATAPAVTLHAYSPPLWRMGAYEVEPSGACADSRSPTQRSCGRSAPDEMTELPPPQHGRYMPGVLTLRDVRDVESYVAAHLEARGIGPADEDHRELVLTGAQADDGLAAAA